MSGGRSCILDLEGSPVEAARLFNDGPELRPALTSPFYEWPMAAIGAA